jgi:hypothetical protein
MSQLSGLRYGWACSESHFLAIWGDGPRPALSSRPCISSGHAAMVADRGPYRSEMSREIHSIPTRDKAFGGTASAALDALGEHVALDDIADALADLLRPTYPAVVVRRQHVVARDFDVDVWYAYRDGAPLSTDQPPGRSEG